MYLPMAKVPPIVNLSAEDQAQLVRWKSTQGTPQQVALRCRLVLAAAEGYPDLEIASHHEVNRHTVALWRERVQAKGIGSVWEIQAGRGRKPKYELEKRDALIRATLETKPKGMTHWSCRTMAKAQRSEEHTSELQSLTNLHPLSLHDALPISTKSIDTLSRCGESACKPKGSVRSGRSKRVGGANRSMSWRSGTP